MQRKRLPVIFLRGCPVLATLPPPSAPAIPMNKTAGSVPGVCATTDNITINAGETVCYGHQVESTDNLTFNDHDSADNQLRVTFTGWP